MFNTFDDFRRRKAENTLRSHRWALSVFSEYLGRDDIDLWGDVESWRVVNAELLVGFVSWCLDEGYAIDTVNLLLFKIRAYARLAMSAGVISSSDYAKIAVVQGYSRKEFPRVDQKRKAAGQSTRRGFKKAQPVTITGEQAKALKNQSGCPAATRDSLVMCLLLDHGLRVGELAALTVDNIDLESGLLKFYRPKVNRTQVHKLTLDTLRAARKYAPFMPSSGSLWRKSRKDGLLYSVGVTDRSLVTIVNRLGKRIGIKGLSPHDLRHYWATTAARNKTPLDRLMDAGGWASPFMALRYIEAEKISNSGVILEVS